LLQEHILPIIGREMSIVGEPPEIDEKKFLKRKKNEAKKLKAALKKGKEAGSVGKSPDLDMAELDESLLQFSDDEPEVG
jgi:hypothetical protein